MTRVDDVHPFEVRAGSAALVGAPVLFLGSGLVRLATEGGGELVALPLLQLLLGLAVAGLLWWRRWNGARLTGIGLALFGGLLHVMVAVGAAPWWARILSGLLAIALIYAAVLLSTRPATVFTGRAEPGA